MLRAIQLENFKAYGQRTIIPIAPITLLFGQNSAGKSSILHALSLLKQSRAKRERATREPGTLLLPRSDQGFVDLGSFKEMVFNHDQGRPLAMRLDLALPSPSRRANPLALLGGESGVGIEWSFVQPRSRRGIALNHLLLFSLLGQEPIATFRPVRSVKPDAPKARRRTRLKRDARVARRHLGRCEWVTQSPDVWRPAHAFYKARSQEFLRVLSAEEERLRQPERPHSFFQSVLRKNEAESAAAEIRNAIEFFTSPVGLDEFIRRMSSEQVGASFTLDGFIPSQNLLSGKKESYVDTLLEGSEDFPYSKYEWTLEVAQIAVEAGNLVDDTLRSIYPLSPFRRPPSRWYIFSGSEVRNVGFDGELLPDLLFRTPSLVEETNGWLERLETGYRLKIRGFGAQARDLYEIRLVDTLHRRNVEVGLLDVGFGISQMLPFIVQSLAANNQIITIEQPEIHVHPRLQADLGDLLAEAIGEPYHNQFIIETHSEHLVLRLQRLVRTKKLQPSDISVVAVRRGAEGSIAVPLRLDEEGDFMDEFPGGFFPERLRELR
jgi:hypothetical protein